jgi:hypothetical protein
MNGKRATMMLLPRMKIKKVQYREMITKRERESVSLSETLK